MSNRDTTNQHVRRPRILWLILLALLAIVIGWWFLSNQASSFVHRTSTSTEEATEDFGPPIEFSIQDLEGEPVQLSDYRGKVVLVNFWATWCAPCRDEMPILQDYYLDHRDDGFVLVAVNVSNRPEEVVAYIEEAGYIFPIWLDPPGNILIDLRVNGLPASLLVDAQGHLRKKWIGPLSPQLLDSEVSPLLAPSAQ
jgi:thiol-disulfide isomerase/thioredoxin